MVHVRKAREQAMCARGTNTPGVGVIAMPLPASPSGARLVIGVGGLIERLDASEKKLVKLMNESIEKYIKQAEPARRPRARATATG